ncbi:TetR family transcriptional regulator [Nocardia donostiensis]|uniref:TetR family transcriptional regulator n=1 Tax=Nocardia donostiensis TaxID=1538463 RepID=A0A1W0B3F2_9NOCA|nr:TetR family transcriptional regulator [Nocardia donostiensis]OQS16968.1 TetR family transcriptional regulator [Nocardia donostiensis]OQS23348.1 TetR family transcriptional regulator [Nocardia donostiensis]
MRPDIALPTDQRLIIAAEHLFAERGIDAVSLRAVMAAAGANVASVHYHFGSKEALVEALISQRGDHIHTRRAELLDTIERSTRPDARALAEAFVRPVAELAAAGGTAWVTFVAGIMSSNHPALARLTEGFAPQARRFTALLEKIDPDAPARTIKFRLTQAMSLTFHTLGDPEGLHDILALSGTELTSDEVVEELVDTVTAILAGPPDR